MSNLLVDEQRLFDQQFFDPKEGYAGLDKRARKVAHIGTNLGIITGRKLIHWADNVWERDEMRTVVVGEVLPDLCIYRTQLADVSGIEEDQLVARAHKLKPGNLTVTKTKIHTTLVAARGALDDFVEPLMHGAADADYDLVGQAAVMLHFSAEAAALHYGYSPEDLVDLHHNRLIQLAEFRKV
jgi:hypothetical protein